MAWRHENIGRSLHDWLQQNASGALYIRLQSSLEAAIREGALKPGSKLPPERKLAKQLNVSRTTVTTAYRELEAKGLVRGFVGRGTYVCGALESTDVPFSWHGKMSVASLRLSNERVALNCDSVNPGLISFERGSPALECFPVEEYRRIEQPIVSRRSSDALGVGPITGQPALRNAIAKEHSVKAEQVLVVAGSQQGLDLLARSLIDPGDHVVVEKPGYFVAFETFLGAGARLVGWDALRSDMGELEDLILRYRPKFICTTPSFQNPTGRTLSLSQRNELIEVAVRYRTPVIEDEPYRELYFDGPPPRSLRELDERGIVVHLSTFSALLAPGLRVGYIVAPESFVNVLALAKQRTSMFTAGLEQLVLAEMLRSGVLAAHLPRVRQEHRLRRDAMIGALQRTLPQDLLTFSTPAGGVYLWARLFRNLNTSELNNLAIREGIAFAPGELFYPESAGTHEMRLCFAGSPVSMIVEGVARLRNAIHLALSSKQ
jgi:DNA-binding transcriptional MocR family regulator